MTVATEAAYAERSYTGVETSFTPGFSALSSADVHAGYFDMTGASIELTAGVHFSASLDPTSRAVTVTRIAFPSASVDAPVIIWITRDTPAIQGTNFQNLNQYDPSVHELIADAGAMRDAELRSELDRAVRPYTTSIAAVDFRPRKLKAADPTLPEDVATKLYADTVSGTSAAIAAAASAAAAAASATTASASATAAAGSAATAAANAALLASPDYGFVATTPTVFADYGSIP